MNPRLRIHRLYRITFVLVAAIVAFFVVRGGLFGQYGSSKPRIEQFIRARVAEGSSREDVIHCLNQVGVDYGWYDRESAFRGIIRHPGLLMSRDVLIFIKMDNKDAVEVIEVRQVFTGP